MQFETCRLHSMPAEVVEDLKNDLQKKERQAFEGETGGKLD